MKFIDSFRLIFLTSLVLFSTFEIGPVYATESVAKEWDGLSQPYTALRQIIDLPTPEFDENLITKYVSGIRPIHSIRPQIDAKAVDYKGDLYLLADCWGHGGAGTTLAPGSAKMVYEKLFQTANLNDIDILKERIAILGAGINGLWVARYLLKQGIPASHITIYAKDFENTVSHIAAGMWLPISMPRGGEDPSFFEKLEDDSYHAYYALAHKQNPKIEGVQELPLYTFNMENEARSLARRGLVPKGTPVILRNQNLKEVEVVYWKRGFFLVDPFFLMPSLKKNLENKEVSFVSLTFSKEEEFFELQTRIIVNCLGLGNRELLEEGQKNLRPSKGELVYLQPQQNINYMLFGVLSEGRTFGFIPKAEGLVIGVTRKPGDTSSEPNEEDAKELLERGRELFSKAQISYENNQYFTIDQAYKGIAA